MAEVDGGSSQSFKPDRKDSGGIGSYGNTEVDSTEDDTASVVTRKPESTDVAAESHTVEVDDQGLPLESQPAVIREPETRPSSNAQLVDEAKRIYARLVKLETESIQMDANHMPPTDGPLDIVKYLLMIPEAKLILLQQSGTRPDDTVRTWFIKVHNGATEGVTPSTPRSAKDLPATGEKLSTTPCTGPKDLPTTRKDCPETSQQVLSVNPYVSAKSATRLGSPDDYLHGFQVALELRAKELEWPECEELAARTMAEIGEDGRKKVIDGKYFLDIGYELVDQLLRDLEIAKETAEKKGAEAKAETEAAGENAEHEIARPEEDNKDSNPDPEETPTSVSEPPEDPEAQSRPPDGTQQAVAKETSPPLKAEVASKGAAPKEEEEEEEVFEEITPREAKDASTGTAPGEIALGANAAGAVDEAAVNEAAVNEAAVEEVPASQQHVTQDANLSKQEPQASPEKAGVASGDSGKNTADTAVDTTTTTTEKTESKSQEGPEMAKLSINVRPRPDQYPYKKIGQEYWVRQGHQWMRSLHGEQWADLFALHRNLLGEHLDFFLASQHPRAEAPLKRLAAKYNMPARMWRHGVHSFLEVMRKRLVESQEYMDRFIILAYGMMSFLEEMAPRYLYTWIECKADLTRYG